MVSANLFLLLRLIARKEGAVLSRSVWKMTPAALVKVCMLPNGNGMFLGDIIYLDKEHPRLWGNPIETVEPDTIHECRIALVDPCAAAIDWHRLKDLLGERVVGGENRLAAIGLGAPTSPDASVDQRTQIGKNDITTQSPRFTGST